MRDIQAGIISLNEVRFIWTISEAKSLLEMRTGFICSPTILDGDNLKWIFKIFPLGLVSSMGYMTFFIGLFKKPSDFPRTTTFNAKIAILNNKGEISNSTVHQLNNLSLFGQRNDDMSEFPNEYYTSEKIAEFTFENEFQNNLDNYINENGEFKVCVEILKERSIFKNDILESTVSIKENTCYNCNDFEKILNSEVFSDLKLVVGNISFLTHKVILAAKSPVFMEIIEKDKRDQIIEINDTNDTIIKEMLRFIHIGQVENIQDVSVDLLAVAYKYQITSLKNLCENDLIEHLTPEKSIDQLILADLLDAENLKKECIKLVAANINNLMNTEDWCKLNSNMISDIIRSGINTVKCD